MEIREAKIEDIDSLIKILIQVNNVHKDGRPDLFRGSSPKYNQEELKKIVSDNNRKTFVMVDNGIVLGYLFGVIKELKNNNVFVDNKTFYIDDLGIDKDYRNQGIGTKLMKHAEKYAKEIGCYNLTLNVWCFKDSAISFYEKQGLKPRNIMMEKIL